MSAPGKFPLRPALYGTVLLYLIGDLFVVQGPLRRQIDLTDPDSRASLAAAKERGVVARVAGQPITRSQLDRTLAERLWLDGKNTTDLSTEELKTAWSEALDELIDQQLLRLQVKALSAQLTVSDSEIDDRVKRLVGRFESKGALEAAMKSQGFGSEKNLRDRLAARIRQEKFVNLRIGPFIRVSDEEAREWFDKNSGSVALSQRIEARHIFIRALNRPPEEGKQKLEAALVELTEKKKDFPTLAKELSEDPANKDNGGSLGWMTRDRLPADFAAPVFALEVNKPALIRTKLGWHIVEVTGSKPAEPRTFDQARPEIVTALEAVKRQKAVEDLRKSLRKPGTVKVEILADSPGA